MKNFLSVSVLTILVLLATSSTLAGAKKKHLGIATYSVKGLESDIEGSFKSLADAGYVVMEISNYNAGTGTGSWSQTC